MTSAIRQHEGKIGFARKRKGGGKTAIAVDFDDEEIADIENFQAHGFLPELIARFTRIVALKPLDRATLKQIMQDNVIERFRKEFQEEGLELTIEEPVLDHIVDQALKRQTGARGLVSLLTAKLEDCAYATFCEKKGRVTMRLDGERLDWVVK
jgi:ATP-dependent Clp protease ATP-binding subunit ClpX